MPPRVKRPALSEKGLLTPDNCIVAFIDLQPHMLVHVTNFDRRSVINAHVMLAKAARVFDIPVVLSTLQMKTCGTDMSPPLIAVYPDKTPIERTSLNPWDDADFVGAIERTGRRRIVLAGLWTQTGIALASVQALHDGYEVFVVEDGCGDVSPLAHDNAMQRVIQAGAKPVTALSVLLEWQRDWALVGTCDAVLDILKTHAGLYGFGVDALPSGFRNRRRRNNPEFPAEARPNKKGKAFASPGLESYGRFPLGWSAGRRRLASS